MTIATSGRLVRNTIMSLLGYAVSLGASLLLLPMIVHTLGNEVYGGIWVIMGTLTASLGLLDLGTGTAFVKFIAEFHAKQDARAVSEVINTGIALYCVVGTVLMAIAWLLGGPILTLVGVGEGLLTDGRFVLLIGMLVFALANIVSPLSAVSTGLQRMEITAGISCTVQLINIVTTFFVLRSGFGVRGLILNNLAILLLTSALQIVAAYRLLPTIRLGVRFCQWSMARRLFKFGINLQASKLAQVLLFQSDRVVSLRLFGTHAAANYDIGAKLCSASRSVALLNIAALVPAASELNARAEQTRLQSLYRRSAKYSTMAAAMAFAFVGFLASDLVTLWMGPAYRVVAPFVGVLAVGYAANVVTGVASAIAAGMGRTDFERRFGVIAAAVNLPATIGGGLLFGPLGVAVGASATLLGGAVFFLVLVHRFLGSPPDVLWPSYGKPIMMMLLAGGTTIVLRLLLFGEAATRVEGLMQAGVLGAVFVVISLGLLWFNGVIDRQDVAFVRSALHFDRGGARP